jgi:hypothetical protein
VLESLAWDADGVLDADDVDVAVSVVATIAVGVAADA